MEFKGKITAIYADGGCIRSNPSAIGGTWSWCAVNENNEIVKSASGVVAATATRLITNNTTEQIALTLAMEAMEDNWSGHVYSDSHIALGRVFLNYKTTNLPANVAARSKAALARLGALQWTLLKGHPTKADIAKGFAPGGLPVSIFNKWCDEHCRLAGQRYLEEIAFAEASRTERLYLATV